MIKTFDLINNYEIINPYLDADLIASKMLYVSTVLEFDNITNDELNILIKVFKIKFDYVQSFKGKYKYL